MRNLIITMAARAISESSDSSEQNSSDESDFYDVNLYDSDVAETSEPPEDTGPRPCCYEPRRVRGTQRQISEKHLFGRRFEI